MCSASWVWSGETFYFYFNRDEQRHRPLAEPPKRFAYDQHDALMPIDPQGGGSWIACDQYGRIFALLNYYQGATCQLAERISRGHIVRAMSQSAARSSPLTVLESMPLEKFSPFSLLCFEPANALNPSQLSAGQNPLLYQWDGQALEISAIESPFSSSGYHQWDAVLEHRQNHYQDLLRGKTCTTPNDLLEQWQSSHYPEASAFSVCMHRDDAKTVSLSRILVAPQKVTFDYFDDAPCAHDLAKPAVSCRLVRI